MYFTKRKSNNNTRIENYGHKETCIIRDNLKRENEVRIKFILQNFIFPPTGLETSCSLI